MASTTRGKISGTKGMILLARNNRILLETVKDQIMRDPELKKQSLLDVKLCDFDEVSYSVKMTYSEEKKTPMVVAINVPCYESIKDKSDEQLKKRYGDRLATDVPAGYDCAVNVDLDNLPDNDEEKRKLAEDLSLIKYTTLSGPYRHFFDLLNAGTPATEPFQFNLRHDTTVYFCPRSDRVTIVYAVDFQEKVDKVIARVFMQELCDARKRIRTAPPFKWSIDPPVEIKSLGVSENPGILGYASIAVMVPHIKGDKVDTVSGALINFRSFIQYHLKCAKSFFHSRMRARCSDLLKILNRARTRFGEKEKKTAKGTTFKKH